MGVFDDADLPGLFTDPETGFGEEVVYTPIVGDPVTINAVWSEAPIMHGLEPQADAIDMRVDVRAEDIPDPQEGDLVERVATGVVGKVMPPVQPDGLGLISCALMRVQQGS